jgi:hypothetical protein
MNEGNISTTNFNINNKLQNNEITTTEISTNILENKYNDVKINQYIANDIFNYVGLLNIGDNYSIIHQDFYSCDATKFRCQYK